MSRQRVELLYQAGQVMVAHGVSIGLDQAHQAVIVAPGYRVADRLKVGPVTV